MRVDGTIPGAACPATIVRRDPPRRAPNAARRPREYLTHPEVEQLIHAARSRGRHGARDAAMILIAYRHGLPASELAALRWMHVELIRTTSRRSRYRIAPRSPTPRSGAITPTRR